jgi:hypothetical protein
MTVEQKTTQKNKSFPFEGNFCRGMMRSDSLDSIGWAAAFIWAGIVVLLATTLGLGAQGWSLFFLGAGVLVLMQVAIRLLVPAYRQPVWGDLIWAGILFGLGTGGWGLIGPLILIAIGASILKNIVSAQR